MSDIPVVAVEIHNATPMSHDNIAPDVVITGEGANCTTMDNDRHVSPSTRTKVTQNGQVPAVYCDDERDLVSRMQNYSDMPNLESHEKVLDTRSVTFHNAHDTMTTSTKEEVSGVNSHPHPSDTEDCQPGPSSSQGGSKQLSTIDSTIYAEEEAIEPTGEDSLYRQETWEQAKARNTHKRPIFSTDMYTNVGEIVREQGLTKAGEAILERRRTRTKLDKPLSEIVLSNDPVVHAAKLSQQEGVEPNNNHKEPTEDEDEQHNHRSNKITMKDVYKEIRLMKQVVSAIVRTDTAPISLEPHDDKEDSIPVKSQSGTDTEQEQRGQTQQDTEQVDTGQEDPAEEADRQTEPEGHGEAGDQSDTSMSVQDNKAEASDKDTTDVVRPPSDMETTEEGGNSGRVSSSNVDNCDNESDESAANLSNMDTEHVKYNQDTERAASDMDTTLTGSTTGRVSNVTDHDASDDGDSSRKDDIPMAVVGGNIQSNPGMSDGPREPETTDPSPSNNEKDQDEDLVSRKDSIFSMDWASTYSNLNDIVVPVNDYRGECVVGCVAYTDEEGGTDPVRCTLVHQADVPSVVRIFETLVSKILHIVPVDGRDEDGRDEDGSDSNDEVTLAIPFEKDEMECYQEPVLRVLDSSDQWREVVSRESIYNRENDSNLSVLLTKLSRPITCAVVAIPIVEDIVFTDQFTRFHSSVDNDIFLTCPVSARINAKDVHVELKVLPVVPSILERTKETLDTDRWKLYSAGAIVTLSFFDENTQTIYMHVPCTRPALPSRPMTGGPRRSSSLGTPDSGYTSAPRRAHTGRKSSSFGRYVEPSKEKECYLVRFASCMATKVKKMTTDDVSVDDQAIFSVHEKSSTSIILEVTDEMPTSVIQEIAPRILTCIEYQNVQICLAHNKKCLDQLDLSCNRSTSVGDHYMTRLQSDNVVTVKTVTLREGDTLCVCFRGNVAPISNHRTIFRYYGMYGIHTSWTIDTVDRYSQRSLISFCGFLQIFVWKSAEDFNPTRSSDLNNNKCWKLVTEIPISLPKTLPKDPPKVVRVPVPIRNEGAITPELLERLAKAIGEGWPKLADSLEIDNPRIQSIKQQHRGKHQELAMDVLMTWFKRSLFVKEKVSVLIQALRQSGRDDLADVMRDHNRRYRREQTKSARDSRMDMVIMSVCKSRQVVCHWKDIASILDLSEAEIRSIDSDNQQDEAKCRAMLSLWKQKQNGYGSRKLVKCMRRLGLNHIADHLTSMTTFQDTFQGR